MAPVLGCVADDFTGATDLANMLVRGGMRTVQLIGVPTAATEVPDADAIVVALKSRTSPVAEAVSQSVASLNWLQTARCQRFFFKYCSTFDSTDQGNIGPVADAMLEALGSDITIACPAFPETGRTIFKGHLFVGDQLLSDTHMRHHPLTPMTDSNLVSVLARQTSRSVGLVQYRDVAADAPAILERLSALRSEGVSYAIVDAVDDDQLLEIGEAVGDLPLVTGVRASRSDCRQHIGRAVFSRVRKWERRVSLRSPVVLPSWPDLVPPPPSVRSMSGAGTNPRSRSIR